MDYKKELILLEERVHKIIEAVDVLAKDMQDIALAIEVIGGGEKYKNNKFIPGYDDVGKMRKEIYSHMRLIKENVGSERRRIFKSEDKG